MFETNPGIPVPAPSWCSKEWISIDIDILHEILYLWKLGIRTTGCCSGHGIQKGYIGVWEEDIDKMLEMGYEIAPNSTDKTRRDSFFPKNCKIELHKTKQNEIYFPVMYISREDLKNVLITRGEVEDSKKILEVLNYSYEKMLEIQNNISNIMEADEIFMERYWEILNKFDLEE